MTALRFCSIAVPFAWKEGPGSDAPILLTTVYLFPLQPSPPSRGRNEIRGGILCEHHAVGCQSACILVWFSFFYSSEGPHLLSPQKVAPFPQSATAPWRIRAPALWKLDLKFSVFFFSMYLIDCWPCSCKIAFYWVWYKLCWTVKGHDMLEEQRSVSPVTKWKMN